MAEARSSKLLLSAFVVVIVAAVSIVVVVLVLRSRSTESGLASALGSSTLDELLAAPSASGGLDSSGSRGVILEKASLKDAIEVARPRMENTVQRLDVGSALLTLWASKKLTWDAVQALPETAPLQFRKDPEAERGKRFCMSGVISSIRAEKTLAGRLLEDRTLPLVERAAEETTSKPLSAIAPNPLTPTPPMPTTSAMPSASAVAMDGLSIPDEDWTIPDDGKVFFATLQEKPQEAKPGESAVSHAANLAQKELMIVEVVAVRSTQGLVDGSEARACGVLTGVTLPYLGSGEAVNDVPQHRIVGMFDLPENHAAPGGERH